MDSWLKKDLEKKNLRRRLPRNMPTVVAMVMAAIWWLCGHGVVCGEVASAVTTAETAKESQIKKAESSGVVPNAEKVTLACYNAEWLLDVFDDPYTSDEKMPPKPRRELEALAEAVKKVNPDILGLEEIENEGVLRAWCAEMLGEMGYRYFCVLPTNSETGQNIGVISRWPVVKISSYRYMDLDVATNPDMVMGPDNPPRRFTRDLLEVVVKVNEEKMLHVFLAHLKSKHDSEGDSKSVRWRTAEAKAIRKQVEGLLKTDGNAWAVVMGDLNDLPGSPPLKALLDGDVMGKKVLVDVHGGLPPSRRISYLKPPYRNQGPIDYMLVTPGLAQRLIADSAGVLSDSSLLGGSDHAPVFASFNLK